MYRTIEKHTNSSKKRIQIVGGDFNAGIGPVVERVSVGPHTLKEGNKRGDWMKQWLMIQNFTALNTMYRKKTLGKQTTYRSPKGTEKQIDYIFIRGRHLKYSKDAEANDMIHMGSDHRCGNIDQCTTKEWHPRCKQQQAKNDYNGNISVHRSFEKMVTQKQSRSKISRTRRKDPTRSRSRKIKSETK